MAHETLKSDLLRFSDMKPPVRRAAYSDRTAWLMAVLSELAYLRFDEEDEDAIMSLAVELAKLTDQNSIAERLRGLALSFSPQRDTKNEILRSVLAVGGFELVGIIFNRETDTQGFVAARRPENDVGMAVIAFRGTQQTKDWMTNLSASATGVMHLKNGREVKVGNVHKGFDAAFKSVEEQIRSYVEQVADLPLYITGHSLGGALATLATWYTSGDKLAACYSFGAPRCGDDGLVSEFRTPIYRIVNGADPVPFVPPSSISIDIAKALLRGIGMFFSPANRLANLVVRSQRFRHYGYQRYLSICDPAADGTYPDLKNEFGISSLERIYRYAQRLLRGEASTQRRIDRYHDIAEYRSKLREFALRRQT
ncbi:MAG: lipase family protein [Nisaea sp.]|uniref:lipase family protein n=1 Tax=Nisaea sp. TaxID=2024842 RepID=UPI001B23BB21|nr:lipase family protein [Nisaea sp.]MBO6559585.1 lipase family protein [Nisaea sp.]